MTTTAKRDGNVIAVTTMILAVLLTALSMALASHPAHCHKAHTSYEQAVTETLQGC